jgi:peptidoglycan/LPS O-acetylase OafA/YrhL
MSATDAARVREARVPGFPSGPRYAEPAPDELPALTGIRFPLALWVVTHHLSAPDKMLDVLIGRVEGLQILIDAAWVALGLFFAISGFVLARRYRTTAWTGVSLIQFGVARFSRVYPLYLLSLLILAPIIHHAMAAGRLGDFTDRLRVLSSYVLLLQGWSRPPVDWNTPAWSLSCEVFFYACFPALVLLVRRLSWPRVVAAIGLALILPLLVRTSGMPTSIKPLVYLADFLIGVAIAGLCDLLRARDVDLSRPGPWLVAVPLASIPLLLVGRDALGSYLILDTGLRVMNAALVLGLACGSGLICRILATRLLVAGGCAAYGIYILHVPMLWWYERSATMRALPPVAAGGLFLVLVVAISMATAQYYERPAAAFVRRYLRFQRVPVGESSSTMPLASSVWRISSARAKLRALLASRRSSINRSISSTGTGGRSSSARRSASTPSTRSNASKVSRIRRASGAPTSP